MMHRVSSRPRLVSDADAAFCAGVEVDEDMMDGAMRATTEPIHGAGQSPGNQDHMNVVKKDSFDSYVSCNVHELENEMMGMFADGTSANTYPDGNNVVFGSTKRKRLSNYMTPASSYANLNSSLIHPLCNVDGCAFGMDTSAAPFDDLNPKAHAPQCCDLPTEALIHMASYLSPSQIRTLSLVNAQFRSTLIHSQAAKESLWMEVLRGEFPQVFLRSNERNDGKMPTSSDMIFVDTSSTSNANLALSTALFPTRYPRQIDPVTLKMDHTRHPFRVLKLTRGKTNADEKIEHNFYEAVLRVVQFMGRVGTGDRCIRSDQPFPQIKKIEEAQHKSSLSLPWKANCKSGRSKFPDNTADDSTVHPSTPSTSTLLAAPSTPSPPQRTSHTPPHHSPLIRFLSSLSHHTDTPMQESFQSTESMELDEEDTGVNNYGMFNFGKCKECLGKIARCRKSKHADKLRPFVVPVILSKEQTDNAGGVGISQYSDANQKPVVDLTPRLCAYFEVTILKQSGTKTNNDETTTDQRALDNIDTLQSVNRLAPRNLHGLPRRQGWRHPHRLPMHPLVAIQDDVRLPPLPMHRERHNDFAMAPRAERAHGSRHECVAIGLSTLAFNPRDKMPGWDTQSYGYHGDDGGLFHGHGDMIQPFGPAFGPGDTVGCGLDYHTKRMFFVKNGDFLGYAFETLQDDVIEKGLYPTVGVDTECPLFVNFGTMPFSFDLGKFVRDGCGNVDV